MRSTEWLIEQIKATAGLAMSTFKDEAKDNIREDVPDEDIQKNVIVGNRTPPPNIMRKWTTPRAVNHAR